MFGHDNLMNYYKVNFILMQHHKYSISDLENMLVWEREVYVKQLESFIIEENERLEQLRLSRI